MEVTTIAVLATLLVVSAVLNLFLMSLLEELKKDMAVIHIVLLRRLRRHEPGFDPMEIAREAEVLKEQVSK